MRKWVYIIKINPRHLYFKRCIAGIDTDGDVELVIVTGVAMTPLANKVCMHTPSSQ